jgi:hypothetical protein
MGSPWLARGGAQRMEAVMSNGAKHFRLGVFMPVGNNGWVLSKTAPQYMPTYKLNRDTAQLAERIGFDYVFSMAKWSGYGGETRAGHHQPPPGGVRRADPDPSHHCGEDGRDS